MLLSYVNGKITKIATTSFIRHFFLNRIYVINNKRIVTIHFLSIPFIIK